MFFKYAILFTLAFATNILAVESDSLISDSTVTDHWIASDKGRHLVGSMLTTILMTKVSERQLNMSSDGARYVGISVTFTLGLGKEILDDRKPGNLFSVKDLTANITGIIIGLIILGIH